MPDVGQDDAINAYLTLFWMRLIIVANAHRLSKRFPHRLSTRMTRLGMAILCDYLMAHCPRPSQDELAGVWQRQEMRMIIGKDTMFLVPRSLLPLAVMRTLMFHHRAEIDYRSGSWCRFTALYGAEIIEG